MARLAQDAAHPARGIGRPRADNRHGQDAAVHERYNAAADQSQFGRRTRYVRAGEPTDNVVQPMIRSTPAFVLALCVPAVGAVRPRAGLAERPRDAHRPPRGDDPRSHRQDRAVAVPQSAARAAGAAPAGRRRRAADRGRAACFGSAVSSGRAVTASAVSTSLPPPTATPYSRRRNIRKARRRPNMGSRRSTERRRNTRRRRLQSSPARRQPA